MKMLAIPDPDISVRELVDKLGQEGETYYLTDRYEVKAVMLDAAAYEALARRLDRLEAELDQVWAALASQREEKDALELLTPSGGQRMFRPNRSVSAEASELLLRAAQLAERRVDWTLERTMQQGEQSVERARQSAIANGLAIADEREAAIGD